MSEQPGSRGGEWELVRAARGGDIEALDRLVGLVRVPLEQFLRRQMGARLARSYSIEDVAQDVLAQATGAMHVLAEDAELEDFRGILFQHARWILAERAKRVQRFVGESGIAMGDGAGAAPASAKSVGPVTREDELLWLQALVERLDQKYARVVELHLSGHDLDTIAARLGISNEAARKRFARASVELKRMAESRSRRDGS